MGAQPYVVYGANSWDREWRDEQHLAHALARRHPVLYVDPPMSFLTPLKTRSPVDWKDLTRRGIRHEEGVALFRPLSLPPLENPRARALARPLLRAQVRWAVRSAAIERPVVLAAGNLGEFAGVAGELVSIFLMEDWYQSGEGPSLAGRDPAAMAAKDAADCDAADIICAISPALQRSLASKGWESVLLRHGFHADLAALYDCAPIPAEYRALARPVIGYAGSIDARLDFEALGNLADRFAHGSLVLVGPVSPRLDRRLLERVLARPNAHLVPFRARTERPAYLRHLDCALLPYLRTEFAAHGAPSKFWEYLYAGAPIVGMGYTDLLNYPPPLAHFVHDPGQLPSVVEAVLRDDDERARAQRRSFALANSWDQRASELEALVEKALSERRAPAR